MLLAAETLDRMLHAAQNPDGGWPATRGRASNTESTALAVLALDAPAGGVAAPVRERGLGWLAARQRPDGAWPLGDELDEPSWATSLAILALARQEDRLEAARQGSRWLLGQEGRRLGWLARLALRLLPEERSVQLDPDLVGWPWRTGSFAWVEPTAYALLALKRMRGTPGASERAEERIRQGERLLYDRVCPGGGWNYGNSRVLGEELWPYPEVTAVALIALQDRASEPASQASLKALEGMLAERASGLSLAWATLCFTLHGRDPELWRARLSQQYAATGFLGETRSLALARLALAGGAGSLRV